MERRTKVYIQSLVFSTVLVLLMNMVFLPETVAAEDIWTEKSPREQGHPPNKERIERMLKRIAEENPEREKQLRQLQKNDLEQFDKQIHQEMQAYFEKHGRDRRRGDWGGKEHGPGMRGPGDKGRGRRRPGRGGEEHRRRMEGPMGSMGPMDPGDRGRGGGGGFGHTRGGRGRGGRWEDHVQRGHEEFIKWFEKNYPEKAKKLIDSREKDPERYMKSFMAAKDKYGDIMKAEKKNPELAKVLSEDLKLKQQSDRLVRQLKAADGEERSRVLAQLENTVGKRFDLIIKKKQLRYEGLKRKLEKLKKQVEKREAELNKLVKTKQQSVTDRVKELAGTSEKINWD